MNAASLDCAATPQPAQGRRDKPANRPQGRMNANAGRRKGAGTTQEQCRDIEGTESLSAGSPLHCRPACPDPAPLEPRPPRRRAVQTPAPAAADRTPAELAPSLAPACPSQVPREGNPARAPAPAGTGHSFTKRGRAWAVHDSGGELVALTLYRKGAAEVVRRLEAMDGRRP
jgi:hypothetical protein